MTNTTKKKKLTKAEMRVAIAKDVIAQIKAKKYNPMQGCWVEQEDGQDYDDWLFDNAENCTVDVQVYTKNIKKCNVCALGSLFVSAVNKYNNVYGTFDTVSTLEVFDFKETNNNSPLLRYFTINQIKLIEHTFEGGMGAVCFDDNSRMINKSYAFHDKYPDSKDRLLAIMKNIVENNGTFKP
jgi:hypothetical protein